ncbi:MAG TPA: hypothetical protein VK641_02195 [Terriglobales bacterium]|nr:hypothetical protein [Terriglobales bacterium]
MKPFGLLGTAVLFSILGMTATVAAQQDDRDKPAQAPAHEDQAAPPQENRAPDAKPAQQDEKRTQQQDEKRTQQDDKQVQDQEKRESRESKDNKQAQDQEKREPKNDKQQPRDDNRAQDNRAQQDKNHPQMKQDQDAHRAAGNGGGRIPDDKFRSHFGREHHFRVSRPTVVSGQPRFEYGGFSFIMVDPWPVGWDYADDCYIDYVDGEYLLFDLAHPGVTIVLNVVL